MVAVEQRVLELFVPAPFDIHGEAVEQLHYGVERAALGDAVVVQGDGVGRAQQGDDLRFALLSSIEERARAGRLSGRRNRIVKEALSVMSSAKAPWTPGLLRTWCRNWLRRRKSHQNLRVRAVLSNLYRLAQQHDDLEHAHETAGL